MQVIRTEGRAMFQPQTFLKFRWSKRSVLEQGKHLPDWVGDLRGRRPAALDDAQIGGVEGECSTAQYSYLDIELLYQPSCLTRWRQRIQSTLVRRTKFGFMPCVSGHQASETYIRRTFIFSGSGGGVLRVR
jgi:hypothetical protein